MINDYNQVKLLTEKELKEILPKWFKFKTKPWLHQISCLVATLANASFLNCLDLGTGKTKIAIDFCRYQHHTKPSLRVLVICPNNAVENWADEIHIHSNMKATCLRGKTAERWDLLKGSGFFVVNFEGFNYMMSHRVKKKKFSGYGTDKQGNQYAKSRNVNKQMINPEAIKDIKKFGFDVLIIDESHKTKSPTSLTFKILSSISRSIPKRLLLTGTPFGNTLTDIWAQYYIMDFGETFGKGYKKNFCNVYFKDVGYFGPKWQVTPSGEKKIKEKIFTKAIRYSETEIKGLPKKVYRTRKYPLSKGQQNEYTKWMDGEAEDSKNVTNRVLIYRQICSGFIYRTKKVFTSNPKLELLRDLLESILEGHKAVIFHEFIAEGEAIASMLKKMKVKYNALNGQIKDKHHEYTQFQTDPKYRVMVAHPVSGGASINLTAADYCIFYSNGHKVIDRKQCEKRIHRAGQKSERVFYYDLVGQGTIEPYMLKNLKEGKDAFDRIIDGETLRKALKGEI